MLSTPATDLRRGRRSPVLQQVALTLAALAVLAQVVHPLLSGGVLHATTVLAVVLFAAAALTDCAVRFGPGRAGAVLGAAGGTGLVAEAVGVRTGVPFGEYAYSGTLGPEVLGVPVVVPLAWTMMAYPALLAGRTLAPRRPLAAVPLAALALASWDLFLDPMMVAEGHWRWAEPTPALPGIPGIPLSNYAGWVLVALVIQLLLHLVLRERRPAGQSGDVFWRPGVSPVVPGVLLGWTWLGSTVGDLVFFDRPWVALWGFVVMGAVVGPVLVRWSRAAASARRPA